VWLEWESPGQDGFDYRAVRFWPHGADPVDKARNSTPNPAYRSVLTLNFDDSSEPISQIPGDTGKS
jgi:CspA family cold shock protein